jgi:hypothetical protein
MDDDVAAPRLEPIFERHQPFYFGRYRAYLTVGSYVIYDNHVETSNVGRIIEVRGSSQIVLNRFDYQKDLANPDLIVAGRITEESCRYMTEVFQTSETVLIGSGDVLDIAFVFKEHDIVAGGRTDICQGISNAYVLRFKDTGESIPANECLAFACDYQSFSDAHDFCYSYHLWICFLRMNTVLSRILGRHKESQTPRMRIKVGMDGMCWRYLTEKGMEVGCRDVQTVYLRSWKRVSLPGLTIKRRQENLESELLRFETESELVGLAGLLGERSLVNVCARIPFSRVTGGREIQENDTINVVVGGEDRESVFKYRVDNNGVDLIFDGVDSMTISVRYGHYQLTGPNSHKSDMSKRILMRIKPKYLWLEGEEEEAKEDGAESDDDIAIYLNEDFEHEGSFYRVSRIENGRLFATCIQHVNRNIAVGRTTFAGDEEEFTHRREYVINKINERY